jgi:hypothetical protein
MAALDVPVINADKMLKPLPRLLVLARAKEYFLNILLEDV